MNVLRYFNTKKPLYLEIQIRYFQLWNIGQRHGNHLETRAIKPEIRAQYHLNHH